MTKTLQHDPDLEAGVMRRGFPRPMFDTQEHPAWNSKGYEHSRFLPTPYSAKTNAIALLSDARAAECLRDVVCSVCGEPVDFNEHGWITVLFKEDHLCYESGPFHDKCATLTMKLCPHIANSNDWAVGMISMDTYIAHQQHHAAHGTFITHSLDCRSKEPGPH